MSPDLPRVTIGIPAFESEQTILRAVRSVQAQSVRDWRMVISDDASSDGTAALCQRLAAEDARIRFVRQPRNLLYMNFGFLVAEARTPFFAWLAADDLWHPTFLEHCLEALAARPEAISAIPECDFVDGGMIVRRAADTGSIEGDRTARARAFLERPNGTRMYGLFRTEVLARAFPPRVMHAYDFALMLGVLSEGPQVGVPRRLLTRNRTPWEAYSRSVRELYSGRVRRALPLLDMSLTALRRGHVPLRTSVLKRLLAMNAAKHEEYVYVNLPRLFVRLRPFYRALALPIAGDPSHVVPLGRRLLASGDRRDRATGLGLLETAAAGGSGEADMVLARHWRTVNNEPDLARALAHYERASRHGATDAGLERTDALAEAGGADAADLDALYLAAAEAGSSRAAAALARRVCAGGARSLEPARLVAALEDARPDGRPVVLRALGLLAERGIGQMPDRDAALRLQIAAATTLPHAARDVGRLVLAEPGPRALAEAIYWFRRAASEGDPWALRALPEAAAARGDRDAALDLARQALAEAGEPDLKRALVATIERIETGACAVGPPPTIAIRPKRRMRKEIPMQRNLVVWGVHRSGTSLATRCIEAMGWYLGRANRARTVENPAGFFENLDLVDLDRRLLEALGTSWANWAADLAAHHFEAPRFDPFRRSAEALLDRLEDEGAAVPWALKDPRMATLAGFWVPLLAARPEPPRHLLVLRHPGEVAASQVARALHDPPAHRLLHRREAMLVLWASNTLNLFRALAAASGDNDLLVLPHATLRQDPVGALERVAAFAGAPAGAVAAVPDLHLPAYDRSSGPRREVGSQWDDLSERLFERILERSDAPLAPSDAAAIVQESDEVVAALQLLTPFAGLLAALERGEDEWFDRNLP